MRLHTAKPPSAHPISTGHPDGESSAMSQRGIESATPSARTARSSEAFFKCDLELGDADPGPPNGDSVNRPALGMPSCSRSRSLASCRISANDGPGGSTRPLTAGAASARTESSNAARRGAAPLTESTALARPEETPVTSEETAGQRDGSRPESPGVGRAARHRPPES